MEERMLLHVHDDVEVAGGTAAAPASPSPREPQPLAGRDSRRES